MSSHFDVPDATWKTFTDEQKGMVNALVTFLERLEEEGLEAALDEDTENNIDIRVTSEEFNSYGAAWEWIRSWFPEQREA
jgi:hypothetical protein